MLYGLVILIHVLVCLFLIAVILLQAGRGGGLSEMWGGGQPQSLFGTQTNVLLTRVTEVCAVVFILSSLVLGIMTTQRGKSLVERDALRRVLNTAAAPAPETAGSPAAAPLAVARPAAETPAPATPEAVASFAQEAAGPAPQPEAQTASS